MRPCLLELISRIYQPFNSIFFLTTNQPTVLSVMTYQPNEQQDLLLMEQTWPNEEGEKGDNKAHDDDRLRICIDNCEAGAFDHVEVKPLHGGE